MSGVKKIICVKCGLEQPDTAKHVLCEYCGAMLVHGGTFDIGDDLILLESGESAEMTCISEFRLFYELLYSWNGMCYKHDRILYFPNNTNTQVYDIKFFGKQVIRILEYIYNRHLYNTYKSHGVSFYCTICDWISESLLEYNI